MLDSFLRKIKENNYRYFFFKILLLVLLVAAIDMLVGRGLRHLYFAQKSSSRGLVTYTLESTIDSLLIFGSSRSNHHYQPEVIEQGLGQSCFIVGRDNVSIAYNYAVLLSTLRRYSPKTVIVDILKDEFKDIPQTYDRLSILLPYYENHPEIRHIVELKGPYEKIKLLSNIYPFNSLCLTILKNNFVGEGNIIGQNTDYRITRGYLPLARIWNRPCDVVQNDFECYEPDSIKVEILKSFIMKCRESGTKIYLVTSPYYKKFSSRPYSLKIAERIANQYGVEYYDFSCDTLFINKPYLFSDPEHLNDRGARIFSRMLIDSIIINNAAGV